MGNELMLGFLLKKSIYDGWDHIFGLFLANIGFLFLFAIEALLWYLNAKGVISFSLSTLFMMLFIPFISFYSVGVCCYADKVTDTTKKGVVFKDILTFVMTHKSHVFLHAFVTLIVCVNFVFATPFYFELSSFFGPLMAFVSIFLSLFIVFGFKYYLPICVLKPDNTVLECIKYSFAYALDNKGITVLLMLRSFFDIIISVPLMGIAPGFCGIMVSDSCATKLLNIRYMLAEEQEKEKTCILWSDVFEKMDSKRYSNRSFKSFLFPRR